ncbi:MAG: PEGA domain-containing protein [Deltaproteobacteria bacterium]|nr:PEGA domain-containing protein [Deltaproteobacteria bacterium]MCB9785819.1 PEGA domain-containing protein [Deltaproteobacteria bacterium]
MPRPSLESMQSLARRGWRAGVSSLVLAALVMTGAPSRAVEPGKGGPTGEGLEASMAVLELYVRGQDFDKTPEYAERIASEMAELKRYAILPRADAQKKIASVMTASSKRVTADKLKQIEQWVREGDELVYTNPRAAIEILAKAKAELKAIMDGIELNQEVRREYFRTQMLLARSHYDNDNREKAAEIMEEIIRVFGDEAKVTDEEYHPNIVALYRETYRRLSEQRRGTLTVRTEPPGAEILINGKLQQQRTPASYDGLYPGSVVVTARKGGRESMAHKVNIQLERPAELSIDIDYETSLAFDDRFGFEMPDEKTLQRRIADFASRVGSLLAVDYVLVTGLVDHDGRAYVDGYLVNVANQKVERQQSLFVKPNVVSNNRVASMARLMAGVDTTAPEPVYKPWYTRWIGWTGAGVALGGAAMTAIFHLQYKDKLDQVQCTGGESAGCKSESERTVIAGEAKDARTLRNVGSALLVVGVGASLAGFLLQKVEDPDAAWMPPSPRLQYVGPLFAPGTAGVGAGFSF